MIKKISLINMGICMVVVAFLAITTDVHAYNDRSDTVTKNYDAWFDFITPWIKPLYPLGQGYVSVTHRVSMTKGSEDMKVCEFADFSYDPDLPFFVDNGNGVWDTPYGYWKSSLDTALSISEVQNGQKVVSKPACKGKPQWKDAAGYVNWSAVKPSAELVSSDENIMKCSQNRLSSEGWSCEAVGEGTVTISVKIPETKARMWGLIYTNEAGWYPSPMKVFHTLSTYKNTHGTFTTKLYSVNGTDNHTTDSRGCRSGTRPYEDDGAILVLPASSKKMSWTIKVGPPTDPTCIPTPGKCNSQYNGQTLPQKPTKDLCTKGTPSKVTGDGSTNDPWKWTCAGLGGGSTANCSALKDDVPFTYDCPFVIGMEGDIIVKFNPKIRGSGTHTMIRSDKKLDPYTTERGSHVAGARQIENQSIPAGDYKIELAVWDGYVGRNKTQLNEQYFLRFTGDDIDGEDLAKSTESGDVPDGVEEADWEGVVDESLSIPAGVTNVVAMHFAWKTRRANSVVPICALLTRNDGGGGGGVNPTLNCNETCTNSAQCIGTNTCIGGKCRNARCPAEDTCKCACNSSCSSNSDCAGTNTCDTTSGKCRNSHCSSLTTCKCKCGNPCLDNLDCESILDCVSGTCSNFNCPNENDCKCSGVQSSVKAPEDCGDNCEGGKFTEGAL